MFINKVGSYIYPQVISQSRKPVVASKRRVLQLSNDTTDFYPFNKYCRVLTSFDQKNAFYSHLNAVHHDVAYRITEISAGNSFGLPTQWDRNFVTTHLYVANSITYMMSYDMQIISYFVSVTPYFLFMMYKWFI